MISLEAQKSLYCMTVCRSWCCRNMVFFKDQINQDDIKLFTLRNIKLEGNKLLVPLKCNWLTNNNKCKNYHRRPLACVFYECDNLKAYISSISNHEAKTPSAYSTP